MGEDSPHRRLTHVELRALAPLVANVGCGTETLVFREPGIADVAPEGDGVELARSFVTEKGILHLSIAVLLLEEESHVELGRGIEVPGSVSHNAQSGIGLVAPQAVLPDDLH